MERDKKEYLISKIKTQLLLAGERANQNRETATKFSNASPSMSGDRHYFESHAKFSTKQVEAYKKLLNEVESVSEKIVTTVEPVCFVELKFEDGDIIEGFFVSQTVLIPGILLFTPNSPVGTAIIGKGVGENFVGGTIVKIK